MCARWKCYGKVKLLAAQHLHVKHSVADVNMAPARQMHIHADVPQMQIMVYDTRVFRFISPALLLDKMLCSEEVARVPTSLPTDQHWLPHAP